MFLFKKLAIYTLFLSLAISSISAEIQRVTVHYTAMVCTEQCIVLLNSYLRQLPGVSNVMFNEGAGTASIAWKPNYPFEFQPVNYAVRRIGLQVDVMYVKFRGTIQVVGDHYYLVSLGDGTKMELLSSPVTTKLGRPEQFSYFTHTLNDHYKKLFREAQARHLLVTVEGPLFEPDRPPLRIDVQTVDIPEH